MDMGTAKRTDVPGQEVSSSTSAHETPDDPERQRILLLVDDDANFRMLLRHALKTEALVIHEAGSGEEALALTETIVPHIALLDICLPGMDGLLLLRKLRTISTEMIIHMTSGLSSSDWIDEAQKYGADGYFTKPFNLKELHEIIRTGRQ